MKLYMVQLTYEVAVLAENPKRAITQAEVALESEPPSNVMVQPIVFGDGSVVRPSNYSGYVYGSDDGDLTIEQAIAERLSEYEP